jgi:hypothetical protein
VRGPKAHTNGSISFRKKLSFARLDLLKLRITAVHNLGPRFGCRPIRLRERDVRIPAQRQRPRRTCDSGMILQQERFDPAWHDLDRHALRVSVTDGVGPVLGFKPAEEPIGESLLLLGDVAGLSKSLPWLLRGRAQTARLVLITANYK